MTFDRLGRLSKRFIKYTTVGTGTYLFDVFLIYLFRTFGHLPDGTAVALGFIIAVSVNFLFSYFWVFQGTRRTKLLGYAYFVGLATIGLFIIVNGTLYLHQNLNLNLYLARTIIAGLVGTMNFLINTFFNFKMTH
ncbi:MAG: GtrA family protein [Patescibacteria group bacterium]